MKKNELEIALNWIKHDLERMMNEIPPLAGQAGNINFPLALCVLSYMEFLGSFLLGKKGGFTQNVSKYIKECFINHQKEYPINILRDIYRNGLSHEYFSRGAISREGEHPAVYRDKNIGLVLDAQSLAEDFLKSLDKFITELDPQEYQKRIDEIKETIINFQERHKRLINNLPEKNAPMVFTTTTTTTRTVYFSPNVSMMRHKKNISTPPHPKNKNNSKFKQ